MCGCSCSDPSVRLVDHGEDRGVHAAELFAAAKDNLVVVVGIGVGWIDLQVDSHMRQEFSSGVVVEFGDDLSYPPKIGQ